MAFDPNDSIKVRLIDATTGLDVNGLSVKDLAGQGFVAPQFGGAFARPADTTAYAASDTISNSTTAGSCIAMTFTVGQTSGKAALVTRARVTTTDTGPGTAGATLRLHLYSGVPSFTNGDNGAWRTSGAGYMGYLEGPASLFSDGSIAILAPGVGAGIVANPTALDIYGVLATQTIFTPLNASTWTASLEVSGQL